MESTLKHTMKKRHELKKQSLSTVYSKDNIEKGKSIPLFPLWSWHELGLSLAKLTYPKKTFIQNYT